MQPTRAPPQDQWPIPSGELSYDGVSLHLVGFAPGEPSVGLSPYYHFRIVIAGDVDVGHINFRVGDTEHLCLCAGHIGFEIREERRGHGYALRACRAIAPFVASIYDAVIITCNPDNHASRKTIERLGAGFIDEVVVPPQDPHYQTGARSKRRYQWKPSAKTFA